MTELEVLRVKVREVVGVYLDDTVMSVNSSDAHNNKVIA